MGYTVSGFTGYVNHNCKTVDAVWNTYRNESVTGSNSYDQVRFHKGLDFYFLWFSIEVILVKSPTFEFSPLEYDLRSNLVRLSWAVTYPCFRTWLNRAKSDGLELFQEGMVMANVSNYVLNIHISDKMCRDNHLDELYKSSGLVKGTFWWLLDLVNFTQRNLWVEYIDNLLKAVFNTFYLNIIHWLRSILIMSNMCSLLKFSISFTPLDTTPSSNRMFHCSMNVWLWFSHTGWDQSIISLAWNYRKMVKNAITW